MNLKENGARRWMGPGYEVKDFDILMLVRSGEHGQARILFVASTCVTRRNDSSTYCLGTNLMGSSLINVHAIE